MWRVDDPRSNANANGNGAVDGTEMEMENVNSKLVLNCSMGRVAAIGSNSNVWVGMHDGNLKVYNHTVLVGTLPGPPLYDLVALHLHTWTSHYDTSVRAHRSNAPFECVAVISGLQLDISVLAVHSTPNAGENSSAGRSVQLWAGSEDRSVVVLQIDDAIARSAPVRSSQLCACGVADMCVCGF